MDVEMIKRMCLEGAEKPKPLEVPADDCGVSEILDEEGNQLTSQQILEQARKQIAKINSNNRLAGDPPADERVVSKSS